VAANDANVPVGGFNTAPSRESHLPRGCPGCVAREGSIYSRLAAPANRSRSVVFSFTAIANSSVTEGL
jgi:hypothetical protein